MAADLLAGLLIANLAAGAAILAVLSLRAPVRRAFGARAAYRLWAAVPLAALATLLPARVVILYARGASGPAAPIPTVPSSTWDAPAAALLLWIGGAAISLGWLLVRQARARRALGALHPLPADRLYRAEQAEGPLVLGLLRPRIVLPSDFDERFSPDERALILAHEAEHLAGGHLAVNGLVSLAACLNWFNPLVHLAVAPFRADQELACDAAVLERRPHMRRLYAQALLKAQPMASAAPLGCQWPAPSSSLLKERIAMVAKSDPGRRRRLAGTALAGALALGAGAAAWAAQPPMVEVRPIYPLPLPAEAVTPIRATAPVEAAAPVQQALAEPAAAVQAQAERDAAPAPRRTQPPRAAAVAAPQVPPLPVAPPLPPLPPIAALPPPPPVPPVPEVRLRGDWSPAEREQFRARMREFRTQMDAWRRQHGEAWREHGRQWSQADAAVLRERYRQFGAEQGQAAREARRTARRARIQAQLAALEAQSRALRAQLDAIEREPAERLPPPPPPPPRPPQ